MDTVYHLLGKFHELSDELGFLGLRCSIWMKVLAANIIDGDLIWDGSWLAEADNDNIRAFWTELVPSALTILG